ncbi:MAG: hypothetical protein R2883_07955 [Caldisericia bacterium]
MGILEIGIQPNFLNRFVSHLKSGKRSKSYIVSGQTNRLGLEFAEAFSMSVNCENMDGDFCGTCKSCKMILGRTHPDFQIYDIEKNKTKIGIETIRIIQEDSSKTNYMAKSRFNIILNADKMTTQAQNALLKTLEDGSNDCTTIMLTDSPDLILPTIHSRSVYINLPPPPKNTLIDRLVELGLPEEVCLLEYDDSGGDLDWLFWLLNNKEYGERILGVISKNNDMSEMLEIILDTEYTEGIRLIFPQILSES